MYNLESAAAATGKAKNTIRAAIVNGRLSARQTATGRWQIDPAELHRVYPPKNEMGENVQPETQKPHNSDILIEVLKQEREREREQYESTIRDLRQRLDRESEERAKLTALLTHDTQPKRRTLFERIFGA